MQVTIVISFVVTVFKMNTLFNLVRNFYNFVLKHAMIPHLYFLFIFNIYTCILKIVLFVKCRHIFSLCHNYWDNENNYNNAKEWKRDPIFQYLTVANVSSVIYITILILLQHLCLFHIYYVIKRHLSVLILRNIR